MWACPFLCPHIGPSKNYIIKNSFTLCLKKKKSKNITPALTFLHCAALLLRAPLTDTETQTHQA